MSAAPRPEPSRITLALDMRSLYGPEVDIACGVVEPAVDQWETGELVPTAEQIELLAKLTDFTPAWFYGPPIEPLTGAVFICGPPSYETERPAPRGLRIPRVYTPPPVEDDDDSFVTPARARLIREQIEADKIVGAPAGVTGCAREGCPGRFGRCYLPASRCGSTRSAVDGLAGRASSRDRLDT